MTPRSVRAPGRGARRGRRTPGGWRRRLTRWLLLAPLVLYGSAALAFLYLRVLPPLTTMVRLQRRVEALAAGRDYDERQRWVGLATLPRVVPRAVVAAEDTRFYQHHGFDWRELRAVATRAARRGRPPRGASTITQQLVKNLFLTTHRSWLRKALEVALTPLAELILPKERILELYLNEIEWGPGVFGIEAAARHHYGVSASRLTRPQALRLAAVIPAPRVRRPARMGWYAAIIDRRMRAMDW
ncbi:MAG TPA: monofunctional biosynthetic peptidoglycan transglycosylase [Gemmatimonadaceae bacterium]|nr:monofunctional biosynthetic peptidoglycan transglycosylase [Gemmatimonadaceae bacterium]